MFERSNSPVPGSTHTSVPVAKEKPFLVKKLSNAGHEIASHSYDHKLCYSLSQEEFKHDTEKSIKISFGFIFFTHMSNLFSNISRHPANANLKRAVNRQSGYRPGTRRSVSLKCS